MRILYFDLSGGISGDMILGALVDIGVPLDYLRTGLAALSIEGLTVSLREVRRSGLPVKKIDILTPAEQPHRNLEAITRIIGRASLPSPVQELAVEIFTALARAEARVHGTTVDDVHFHEIGALDAIADIVGAALCIDFLHPDIVAASPFRFGTGTVRCAHGVLSIPVPAVQVLTEGEATEPTGVRGELVTPTGAAVLMTLKGRFRGELRTFTPIATGYGAGDREYAGSPGYLRVVLGESSPALPPDASRALAEDLRRA
ncbi:MAG: LarC family nickel insertion protein [Planctomycetota bacterium]